MAAKTVSAAAPLHQEQHSVRPSRGYGALIGDVVGSRLVPHRDRLQVELEAILEAVNKRIDALQPLQVTIGDEFQGLYRGLPDALAASMLIHIKAVGHLQVRMGVGIGTVSVIDWERQPYGQDGSAWWAARDAINMIQDRMGKRNGPRHWSTAAKYADEVGTRGQVSHSSIQLTIPGLEGYLIDADPQPIAIEPLVNGYLIARDELLSRLTPRDGSILWQLSSGCSQRQIADVEGISQSAVSQRIARNGLQSLHLAHETLQGLGHWFL